MNIFRPVIVLATILSVLSLQPRAFAGPNSNLIRGDGLLRKVDLSGVRGATTIGGALTEFNRAVGLSSAKYFKPVPDIPFEICGIALGLIAGTVYPGSSNAFTPLIPIAGGGIGGIIGSGLWAHLESRADRRSKMGHAINHITWHSANLRGLSEVANHLERNQGKIFPPGVYASTLQELAEAIDPKAGTSAANPAVNKLHSGDTADLWRWLNDPLALERVKEALSDSLRSLTRTSASDVPLGYQATERRLSPGAAIIQDLSKFLTQPVSETP